MSQDPRQSLPVLLKLISFGLGRETHTLPSDGGMQRTMMILANIYYHFYTLKVDWNNMEQTSFMICRHVLCNIRDRNLGCAEYLHVHLPWSQLLLRQKGPGCKCYVQSGLQTNQFLLFSFNIALSIFYIVRGKYTYILWLCNNVL